MAEQPQQHTPDPELGEAFYGFVASTPKLTRHDGMARLYFKAGQEHWDFAADGSRTKLPTTFHDVIAFRGAAESGDRMLTKQDWFVAHGRLDESRNPNTGAESKEFIANRFGHDFARMNTEVGSPRRRSQMDSPNREQQRQVTFTSPEQDEPDREQPERAM